MWGRPAAEKMGIFWPRAIEFITSMVEIPVWIISSGYCGGGGGKAQMGKEGEGEGGIN